MDMKGWLNGLRGCKPKKAIPVLSFPSISLLNITVKELINDSSLQAKGMTAVAERIPSGASVSMMDLSVEAEAFGSQIRIFDDEVPSVTGSIVDAPEDAEALEVPAVGAGRTGKYIEAIRQACGSITDRPVFAGVIGPFSLTGRLMDVSNAMINCYEEPEMVHAVMEKTTAFLTEYIKAYKETTGAGGVVMAEPLTGLMSSALAEEFSVPYVKRVIDAVQDDDFLVIYHNCGGNAVGMLDALATQGAAAYHFGNSVSMKAVCEAAPPDIIVMGNIDPAVQFRNGTPESIREATLKVMKECCSYPNFVISSGCDIPPGTPWKNIDAFFAAVDEFYAG